MNKQPKHGLFSVFNAIKKFKKANSLLIAYYEGIQNIHIASLIDLFHLLGFSRKTNQAVNADIRLQYGVFVDFFSWHGIIIDVNTKGYSIYVNEDNKHYQSKGREILFDVIDGDYYIAKRYTTLSNYTIPNDYKTSAIQYNMYNAIVDAMRWLNI